MYQNIVLAYDGSPESQQALLNCRDLSQWQQAHVHLLAVIPYDLPKDWLDLEHTFMLPDQGLDLFNDQGAPVVRELRIRRNAWVKVDQCSEGQTRSIQFSGL
jgi:hypothetical protein